MVVGYLERRKERKLAKIREKYPEQTKQIELVARYNSSIEDSEVKDFLIHLENRPSFKWTGLLAMIGAIGTGIASFGLAEAAYNNSKEDMLLFASTALVSLAIQTYVSRRIFNYNNKSKEYEKRRIDASPNAPSNQNNLTIRHDRLENILSL